MVSARKPFNAKLFSDVYKIEYLIRCNFRDTLISRICDSHYAN